MKRFKGTFLVLVIILLSLGLASTTYARERNGSSGRDRDFNSGSRGYRNGRDKSGGFGGPKLNYDGKTSGIGSRVGGLAGGTAGGAVGGLGGKIAEGLVGEELGSRAGNSWEKRTNQMAHDRWNNKGRYGNTGWRCFSLDEDENYE